MPHTKSFRSFLPKAALTMLLAGCPDQGDSTAPTDGPAGGNGSDAALVVADGSGTGDASAFDAPPNDQPPFASERDASRDDRTSAPDGAVVNDGDDANDSDVDAVERVISLVLAAPDLPPQYVCLASFATDGSGHPVGEPVLAGGPFGVPDRADSTGKTLRSGFPYGSVVKLPLFRHDRMYFEGLLPIGFLVDDVDLHETVRGGDSPPCKHAWVNARTDLGRQVSLAPVAVGSSFISAVTGCRASSTAPACGGGNNLATAIHRLDTPAMAVSGDALAGLAFQVANLSAAQSLQNVDAFLQPMRTSDAGSVASGALLPLSSEGITRGQLTPSVGVDLTGFDPESTQLLLVPRGATPCTPGDGCSTLAVPIEPFRALYAAPTGGATGAAWDGHQVLAFFGSAEPAGDGATGQALRLAVFRSTFAGAR